MEKINVAWELVGKLGAGIGILVALVQGFKYLRSQTSVAKLEDKVAKNTENLEKDLKHLERIDRRIDQFEKQLIKNQEEANTEMESINESLNIFGSSMASLINHMIDGNHIDKLKEERNKLTDFFIKRY